MTGASEVRRQVWQSLVSMLQVYAHAASLDGSEYSVAGSSSSAAVSHGGCVLNISFSAISGAASWQLMHQDHGTFQIDHNGILIFPEGPKELDIAAIEWIGKLGQLGQSKTTASPRTTAESSAGPWS